nr:hypothetical protein [Tanacetum cinerariifolium]
MKTSEEVSKEDLKAMMQLVPVEEVYVEALQVKHPIIDWEIYTEGQRIYWKIIMLGGSTTVYQFFVDMLKHFDREDLNQLWTLVKETLSIRQAIGDKEKELWVELKRLYKPDVEDQLWTQTQALMYDPVEWRLYDTCGVHHVLSRDQEIFISTRSLTVQDKEMIEGILSISAFDSGNLIADGASKIEHSNPTLAKIPILDTGKFEQWKFKIQQYLQNEHYALWEVIELRDSYEAPQDDAVTGTASEGSSKKREGQLQLLLKIYIKGGMMTGQELWVAILNTFGGNEATKKAKKNQLKQQYGNFKAECSKTLEQTFNRLQAIISHLEFMDVEIKQDDLNQKFLTSLAPEWLMYTIMWRNRSDLDTMSLDDVHNHLKVYEPEVQKKSESNSQNMAFISLAKNSSRNGEVNTATSQSNGSQIKYDDINQIDEDDIKEIDIKWNMALMSMRADKFWKKTRKKISIQEVLTISVPTGSGLVSTTSPIFTAASVATPYARRKDGLDRGNEQIAKHLYAYEQAAAELTIRERIEQIIKLVKYQDHHSKILKYQAQQRKPLSKKQQKEFYMSVLKSHAGWKTKHFKGMSLEEIKEKFIPVWKQIEDFVPMAFKEEGERFKRKGLMLEHSNAKKMKTSEEVSEEDLKVMMQLVPVEEVSVEALQVKHPIIDWEIYTEGQRIYWKIIRLGGSTAV